MNSDPNSTQLITNMIQQHEVYIRNAMNGMALTMFPNAKSKKSSFLRVCYLQNGAMNQRFYLSKKKGKFLIRNMGTGKAVDLDGGKSKIYSEAIGYDLHEK